ncbi:MAG: hypothetical protein HKN01_09135 [Acidimicrobiia bacterium]|nr:hypothetical protein [Acidimicrobiia bacterium]NNF69921.1 hypothetical protein [Acidimicrobiia bacterium]NNK92497.1 hypothetical protein [Acidimicrobiia bacterium]
MEGPILNVTPGLYEEVERDFFEKIGHPVLTCHGPVEEPCPLLRGEDCSLVDESHGVLFKLDLDDPRHRAILRRYQALLRPGTPIRVQARPGQASRYAETLAGVEVWDHEPTIGELDGFAAEIEAADS